MSGTVETNSKEVQDDIDKCEQEELMACRWELEEIAELMGKKGCQKEAERCRSRRSKPRWRRVREGLGRMCSTMCA